MQRCVLTAAAFGLPTLYCDVAVLAADCNISLNKLTLDTINCWIFAQSAAAGINE